MILKEVNILSDLLLAVAELKKEIIMKKQTIMSLKV
jgi:hypothetical protein